MKYLLYLFFIIVLCGLNSGLLPVLQIKSQGPNFLFLIVFILALEERGYFFTFAAVISGLFSDFFSGLFAGTFTFALLITGFALHGIARNLFAVELNPKYLALFLPPGQALFYLSAYFFGMILVKLGISQFELPWGNLWQGFGIVLAYNLIFLYPIYFAINWLQELFNKYLAREYKIK